MSEGCQHCSRRAPPVQRISLHTRSLSSISLITNDRKLIPRYFRRGKIDRRNRTRFAEMRDERFGEANLMVFSLRVSRVCVLRGVPSPRLQITSALPSVPRESVTAARIINLARYPTGLSHIRANDVSRPIINIISP